MLSGRGRRGRAYTRTDIAPDITRRGSTLWWWLFPLSEAYLYADRLEEARPLADVRSPRPVLARPGEMRRMPCASLGDIAMHSHPPAFQQAAAYYQPALPWPTHSACARSRPTATVVSACCMPPQDSDSGVPFRACDGHGAVPVDGHDLLASRDRSALARVEGSPGSIS